MEQELRQPESWHCWVPLEKSVMDAEGRRMVQGIASTEEVDLQGEIVLQSGIDTAYFLQHGFINDDHQRGPEFVVGEPTEAKQSPPGLFIKGFLYKNHKRADGWWELLNALEASDSNRHVGFSIQGKVLRRGMGPRSHVIEKCWLQDVAITKAPINTHSFAEVIKAMVNQDCDSLSSVCRSMDCNPWVGPSCACKSHQSHRAFSPEENDLKKRNKADEDEEDGEKALSASSPLGVESLEGKLSVLKWGGKKNKKNARKSISFGDAVTMLQFSKGYSRPVATALASLAFEDLADGQGGRYVEPSTVGA